MSILLSDEMRLACALVLNGVVLALAWQTARRLTADTIQRGADTLLLWYLVQYLAVGIPGLLGILSLPAMAGFAIGISILFLVLARWNKCETDAGMAPAATDLRFVQAVMLFIAGYVGFSVYIVYPLPAMSVDAMVYHMPAAAQWLRTGSLGLYETWFWNPANTYSPLGGSVFIAWMIAPLGNDILARFVQAPAILLLFFAMLQLCRALGCGLRTSALVAAAAVLARPFVSQTIIVKDDVLMAAFFAAAVAGMIPERLRERSSPWRLGAAVGLFLSIKYPALLSLPLFFLVIDLPWKNGWRAKQWATTAGAALVLAGPWYLRNLLLTGNPLYPMQLALGGIHLLDGPMVMRRSLVLQSGQGIWRSIVTHYSGLTIAGTAAVATAWVSVIAGRFRVIWRDPLVWLCVVGPVIGVATFLLMAPYAEVRFVYPSVLLLYGCWAAALGRFRVDSPLALAGGGIFLVVSALGAFLPQVVSQAVITGLVFSGIGAGALLLPKRVREVGAILTVTVLSLGVYIYWQAYVEGCRSVAMIALAQQYPGQAKVWNFIEHLEPQDAPIAYANTHYIRPLMGFDYQRRVCYAPVRKGVHAIGDLPRFPQPVSGEQTVAAATRLMVDQTDRKAWLSNLRASGAKFLVIFKLNVAPPDPLAPIPEMDFAASDPGHFTQVYDDADGTVYQIRWAE